MHESTKLSTCLQSCWQRCVPSFKPVYGCAGCARRRLLYDDLVSDRSGEQLPDRQCRFAGSKWPNQFPTTVFVACCPQSSYNMENVKMKQLVQEIKKHEVLYNYNVPGYSSKEICDAAWLVVAAACDMPGTTEWFIFV